MSFFSNLFKAVVGGALLATGVGAVVWAAGFGAAIGVSSLATLATFAATAAVLGGATYAVSTLLAGTPPKFDLSRQIRGQLVSTRSPNEATRVVYGETRLGGPILFMETAGDKNETMFMVLGIAGHACWPTDYDLYIVFIDDEPHEITWTDGVGSIDYKDSTTTITLEKTFPANLLAETEASGYTFSGLQAVAVKLVYDQDKFPNGLPNITFEVFGKAIEDPRTSTTAYSDNAALAIRDYLLNTDYGMGVTSAEIDDQSFEDAADVCDEQVPIKPYEVQQSFVRVVAGNRIEFNGHYLLTSNATISVTGILTGTATGISLGTYFVRNRIFLYKSFSRGRRTAVGASFQISATADGPIITIGAGTTTGLTFEYSSSTQNRYTINGAFQTSEQPQDILSKMLTSCGGKLTYQGGKWVLKVAKFYSPTITLTEDDVVGQISVQASQSRRDIFNAVKGLYSEPAEAYQPFSFPAVTNSTYEAEDGEQIWKDVQFPFTTSFATCQRLSKIDLEKARQQIAVNVSCNIKNAFALAPGDVVNLTFERYGWSAKPFEVLTWEFSFSDGDSGLTPIVNLTLRETASAIYTWSLLETQIDLAPNTNLPDPFFVNPPGITVSDELTINAEQVVTKLIVEVTGENTFQNSYEVEAKQFLGTSTFTALGQSTGNRFELLGVQDGAFYVVRARSINAIGVRSLYVGVTHQVVGGIEPPQDVTDFSVNIVGAEAHLSWTPVTDLDLSHYRIRHSTETLNATYSNAVDMIRKVPRPAQTAVVPAITGTYFIKAVDKGGRESLDSAASVVLIDEIPSRNFIENITESPTFAGVKTNCIAVGNTLILDTSIDFDDLSGLFDDGLGFFDGGGGFVSPEGEYEFANIVNLGAVYTSRVTARLAVSRLDYVDTFDAALELFDSRAGRFDGSSDEYGNTSVALYVARTNDDPTGTPTYTDWRRFVVGDYKGWGLKFKAVLTSEDDDATPVVNTLQVRVDMPDRFLSDDDLASGTDAGGYAVAFTEPFKVTPVISITAQDLDSGDFYQIVSKSASGFTIRFKNSGGTVVSRTFDWVAKGYGQLIT